MKIVKVVHTSYQSFAPGDNYCLDNPDTAKIELFISNWQHNYENELGIIDARSWNVEVYYDDGTIKKYQGQGYPNNYNEFLNYMKENGQPFKRTIKFRGGEIELP